MKAVIFAGGKSTRTLPLTETRPKPLLLVANKALIEHNLDALQGLVSEVVLVVGYCHEQIINLLGDRYGRIRLKYVLQREQKGTAHALLSAEGSLDGRFAILMGDDIYSRKDLESCLKIKDDGAILVRRVENPSQYGVCSVDMGFLTGIVEKPKVPESDLVNAALYVADVSLFGFLHALKPSKRGELELTDGMSAYAKSKKVRVVESESWVPITFAWDLLKANRAVLDRLKPENKGCVEQGAVIKGKVSVGKGTIIRSGAYIEGPVIIGKNCKIGPNCHIRPYSAIGDNSKVGNGCEVKNSVIFNNSSIGHLSYVGDSVLGESVNLGAGTITANLRHDSSNVKTCVNNKIVDTGLRKLGTMIGDVAHTGIHTSIYPGRCIYPNKSTLPGQIVDKDVR